MSPDPSPPDNARAPLARSILKNNLRVRPGERVTIEAWPHTLPWAVALAREARRIRALPLVLFEDETAYWETIRDGGAKVLGAEPAHEWAALAKTDVYIHLWGPGDRVRLNALPPAQGRPLFRFNAGWYAAARKAGLRGVRLELGRPYPTLAAAYGVDQREWTEQLIAASRLAPALLARRAAPIARALQRGRRLRIRHANGTDLTLGLLGKPARIYDGRPHPGDPKRPFDLLASVPSGALRVALDDTVADGTLVGNRTCYYDDGVARGPTFEFSGGRLVRSTFASGAERFDRPFARGGKGRDRPGLFSIGLNPELHDTPQVEDIEAGAVMVSVGGNAQLGGRNRSPFFGWAITAGADVEIDGRPLPTAP